MSNHSVSKLKGLTILKVKVVNRDYGLPQEVIISADDGYDYYIDGNGKNEGECGIYPCLNFRREKRPEPSQQDFTNFHKTGPERALQRFFQRTASK